MKKGTLIICLLLNALYSRGTDGIVRRGFHADRAYLQMNWASTFYAAPKSLEGSHKGIQYVPYAGFEAGMGVIFPFRFNPEGRYFHYATDVIGGINPISFNLDLKNDEFGVAMDHHSKVRFNNTYFTVRQTMYWYNRASLKRIRKTGIGIGARSITRSEFSWISSGDSENRIRAEFLLDGIKGEKNWTSEFDLQLVKGWQWLSKQGNFLGFDLFVDFNFGRTTVYRYDIRSPSNSVQGRFEVNTNYFGVRFVSGISGGMGSDPNSARFPD